MTVNVRPAVAGDRPAWDTFLAARPEADVLQSWAWGEAMRLTGQSPVRVLALDDRGSVVGIAQVLVRRTSLGRSVLYAPHGPVWIRDAPDADRTLGTLLGSLRDAGRAARGVVVKVDPAATRVGADDAAEVAGVLAMAGLRTARHDLQARTTLLVDLGGGTDALVERWTPDARNLARRSAREGVAVEIHRSPDPASIRSAHEIFRATGRRSGFRTHEAAVLERLAEGLSAAAGWYLAIARLEGRPLGAMVVARTGDRAAYLYGGSLRDDAHRHANAGYGVMAAMMTALSADGVRWLDMWGVHDPRDPEADASWLGFSAFKRRFGGREVRHPGTFDLVVSPTWYALRELRERIRVRR